MEGRGRGWGEEREREREGEKRAGLKGWWVESGMFTLFGQSLVKLSQEGRESSCRMGWIKQSGERERERMSALAKRLVFCVCVFFNDNHNQSL